MDARNFEGKVGRDPRAPPQRSFVLILPALFAAIYPWLLTTESSLIRSSGLAGSVAIAIATIVTLLAASTVMLLSFFAVRTVANGIWPRILSHLAFTTPTLIVALGNFASVLSLRGAVAATWLVLWTALAVMALAFPGAGSQTAFLSPSRRFQLTNAHGISACAIIILFLAPHLSNHLTGLWSGATHIAVMKFLRHVYRNDVIQPLLFTLIAFQILSGLTLVGNRIGRRDSLIGALQTMTGIYVAVFFLGHMTAVFAARHAGTDTNWNWLTDNDKGLLVGLRNLSLVGHYWVGPIAIITHIACGLRAILLQHRVSLIQADRLAFGLMGLSFVVSSAILAGLIGIHLA